MNLSEHFTIVEFEKSRTAERLNIENKMGSPEINCSTLLCEFVLETVRAKFGPIYVSSGYRCLELNRALKSKDTSQHILGEAADIVVKGVSTHEVSKFIFDSCVFDQVIDEDRWTHVSYKSSQTNRGHGLVARFDPLNNKKVIGYNVSNFA